MEWSLTGVPLPITLRPLSPLTDDELIAFSRKNKPYQIEKNKDGDITIMTPGWHRGWHSRTSYWYAAYGVADEDGRGEANGANAGWNLPDGSTLSPDACWTSSDRVKGFDSNQRERFLPLCPDFIVEVRSRRDSLKLLQAKMDIWLANGAQLAWMFDPYKATVTIYRPNQEPETLQRPEVTHGEGPVARFRLTTAKLRLSPGLSVQRLLLW